MYPGTSNEKLPLFNSRKSPPPARRALLFYTAKRPAPPPPVWNFPCLSYPKTAWKFVYFPSWLGTPWKEYSVRK